MVRRLVLLVFLFIPFLLISCSHGPTELDEIEEEYAHLNICVLGNSFSDDSFNYVPFILKQYGITCCIHIYCRPNGTLQFLDSEWDTGNIGALHFYIDTRVDKKWRSTPTMKASEVLEQEQWDIISLQQYSLHVRKEQTYDPFLSNILAKIKEQCTYPMKIAWFMAYNRANDDDNEVNLSVQHKIIDKHSFDLVFPVSTAIFNCQANEELSKIGESEYGKFYCNDNIHIQQGLPSYTAALAIVEALLREIRPAKTVLGDKIRPTQEWIQSIGAITPHGKSVGIDEINCMLVQKAAINANDSYFVINPVY